MPVITAADARTFALPAARRARPRRAEPRRPRDRRLAPDARARRASGPPTPSTARRCSSRSPAPRGPASADAEHEVAAGEALVVPAGVEFSLANPYDEPFEAVVAFPVGGRADHAGRRAVHAALGRMPRARADGPQDGGSQERRSRRRSPPAPADGARPPCASRSGMGHDPARPSAAHPTIASSGCLRCQAGPGPARRLRRGAVVRSPAATSRRSRRRLRRCAPAAQRAPLLLAAQGSSRPSSAVR